MENSPRFTIGADPEFGILVNGNPVSIVGLLGGTKRRPKKVPGGAVQEDNVNAEFNIIPADSRVVFRRRIMGVRKHVLRIVREKLPDAKPNKAAATEYPPHELDTPQAREAGCDPDFNAWTGKVNESPKLQDTTLRTAGGHVHVGYGFQSRDEKELFVKLLDLLLGAASLQYDTDTVRRRLYGKAGCWRDKPYGLEYRVLSNFWIMKGEYVDWVYDQVEFAIANWEWFKNNREKWVPKAVYARLVLTLPGMCSGTGCITELKKMCRKEMRECV